MTIGKDVSDLFTHVLKCVETEDLELKKLVYLYIINYSKAQPDLALMAINTFRKDSTERINPLVRALAVRTMGSIGIEQMLEYLLGPLQDAMNDEDAFVRKTAVMCDEASICFANPGSGTVATTRISCIPKLIGRICFISCLTYILQDTRLGR